MYTFENLCLQDKDISLGDKTSKIFLNTKGTLDDIPIPLRNFLNYIDSGEITDEYTKELNDTVIEVRRDKRWRDKIMTLEEYAQQKAKQAAKVAREEGINAVNTLYSNLIADGREDDMKKALSDEEFRESLFKEYNINA